MVQTLFARICTNLQLSGRSQTYLICELIITVDEVRPLHAQHRCSVRASLPTVLACASHREREGLETKLRLITEALKRHGCII